MAVVVTSVLSSPVPGIWRRLGLISRDGSVMGIRDDELVGRLEELGIPRHQLGLVHMLQSWQQASVPPDVAFALWLLRDREEGNGRILRKSTIDVDESSPAIRYIQLAGAVGETLDTDPTLRRVTRWLLDRQLPDGSIPLIISAGYGETGQTSRSLRVLGRLAAPSLDEQLEAMVGHLCETAISQPVGHAWAYSKTTQTVVTGSTSHAVLALMERGVRDTVVTEGLRYLLASQDEDGGWAEVPGYATTIHNTYNVVRTIRAARRTGLLTDDPEPILDRARGWLLRSLRHTPWPTIDLAFALRLATELDLLHHRRIVRLARQLAQRRRQTLRPTADMYAETEIWAIALLECSRHLEAQGGDSAWDWRWTLPAVPPPFLVRGTYVYELLYSAVNGRGWVRVVDAVVKANLLERAVVLILGIITALGIVDDHVIRAIGAVPGSAQQVVAYVVIGVLLLMWLAVKTSARSSILAALKTSFGPLAAALLLSWILSTGVTTGSTMIALVGICWLIIDVIAFAADSTGLLNRLLPKG